MMMMMKEERGARVCETCRAAACAVYCRADSAYLCTPCDARVHGANRVASWHERVRVCEACERAPAAFLCKADAASLCSSCDADIHSANPLARRHVRIPILPIHPTAAFDADEDEEDEDEDQAEAASWLILNPAAASVKSTNSTTSQADAGFGFGGGGAVDDYLDLVEFNHGNSGGGGEADQKMMMNLVMNSDVYGGGDSVVPCGDHHRHHHHHHHGNNKANNIDVNMMFMMEESDNKQQSHAQLGTLDFDLQSPNNKPGYAYSVSVSSMDASVVPDSSTMSEISVSHPRPPKGTIDLFSSPPVPMATQLTPLDREARVLRYREKKKNRKFEKTIRYASRKAYAETRPRIKGRFAKRTSVVDVEVDQLFSTALMADTGYGIVPSF